MASSLHACFSSRLQESWPSFGELNSMQEWGIGGFPWGLAEHPSCYLLGSCISLRRSRPW